MHANKSVTEQHASQQFIRLARGGYVTLPPINQIRCRWARRSGHGGHGCDDELFYPKTHFLTLGEYPHRSQKLPTFLTPVIALLYPLFLQSALAGVINSCCECFVARLIYGAPATLNKACSGYRLHLYFGHSTCCHDGLSG